MSKQKTEVLSEELNQSITKFIYHLTEGNYKGADLELSRIVDAKVTDRLKQRMIEEGLFDRLGAKASGLWAGTKAKAQNLATKVTTKPKAAFQAAKGAVTGQGFDQATKTLAQGARNIANNDPAKAAKAAKADSIIASFEKDLKSLYPNLNTSALLGKLRSQLNFAKS